MNVNRPSQLVTDWERLRTLALESCVNPITFLPAGGQTLDGHKRSMAGASGTPPREHNQPSACAGGSPSAAGQRS
jgi:hypothetical protein